MNSTNLLLGVFILLASWSLGGNNVKGDDSAQQGSIDMVNSVRFFVDPETNSDNPDIHMAYGLNLVPPWDGGSLFINFPEHLEYMPGTRGIARHHDKRRNVWQVSADGSEAWYEVESLTEPGVFFSVKARAGSERAFFEMTITNRSQITLKSIRPLICYQYNSLKGFPAGGTDNFAHTFIVINGRPVAIKDLKVENPEAPARMAQVKGCPDEHNWWAEKMGGFIEELMDMAFTALAASDDDRKVIVFWTPGKNLLSNSAIPCIHADPYFGDLAPRKSRSARGVLIFTRSPLEESIKELAAEVEQPWKSRNEAERVKESKVRIGSAQPRSSVIDYRLTVPEVLAQVDKSLETLTQIIHKAGDAGCDMLALPEDTLGLIRWEAGNPSRLVEVLPEAVKRMLNRLGQAAGAHRMYLLCCSDTIETDGALYNTAFLLDRDGKEIGRYHKVNMPIHELNKKRGNGFPVFRTPDVGDVGMLICYDMVFPEAARCLALGGADIIFHLTLGGAAFGDGDISRVAFRTRAAENFVYIVVSQRGNGSMIISPRGKVIAEGKSTDDLVTAEINPFGGRQGGDSMNWQEDMRSRLFRERHPAAFGLLTQSHPPVLDKVPSTIGVEEAVRISQGALTMGEERFAEADKLLREGKTAEAINAFRKLRSDYPYTWIDRVALERLKALRAKERE